MSRFCKKVIAIFMCITMVCTVTSVASATENSRPSKEDILIVHEADKKDLYELNNLG